MEHKHKCCNTCKKNHGCRGRCCLCDPKIDCEYLNENVIYKKGFNDGVQLAKTKLIELTKGWNYAYVLEEKIQELKDKVEEIETKANNNILH